MQKPHSDRNYSCFDKKPFSQKKIESIEKFITNIEVR